MSGFEEKTYDLGICQLLRPSFDDCCKLANSFVLIEPWKTLKTQPKRLAKHFGLAPTTSCRMSIVSGDSTIGIICVQKNWLVGPYLEFLGVLPRAQGKGIGAAVMRWLEDEAVKSKARNIFLCVSDFNSDAISFYQSFGFEECANLDGLIVDNHGELLLRKRLS